MKNFSANITVSISPKQKDQIVKLFASEDNELSNNRASYEIEGNDNEIVFAVKADDAVALRAMTNAVCKTLAIFEKMHTV
jgi:tRNA threonylcarbamoyladenosine modification (KEOPS) complex  Pcc1 subunit